MQPTTGFDPLQTAKSLIRSGKQGALATLVPGSGDPYCSLVNTATAPDGSPVLLISGLALHTKNILADPRVSLMIDERRAGDPLEGARVMIAGRAEKVSDAALLESIRRRYLLRHPSAEAFVDFPDFAFFKIAVRDVHLVAGFGRIVTLEGAKVLTDLSGADEVLAGEASAVEHMNEDHMEANALYATRLLGA
jgi:putative heme iron utilization protein